MTFDDIQFQVQHLQRISDGQYPILGPSSLVPIWQWIQAGMIDVQCHKGTLVVSLLQPGKVALATGKGILHRAGMKP